MLRQFLIYLIGLGVSLGLQAQQIRINEVLSSNNAVVADEFGDFSDYIELYNYGKSAINLKGFYLSDDPDSLYKFQLPDLVIAAGGYLILWADGETHEGKNHLPFKLNAKGEHLILTGSDLRRIDEINLKRQFEDISFGRDEMNDKEWTYQPPSPLKPNKQGAILGLDRKEKFHKIKLVPDPKRGVISFSRTEKEELKVQVIDKDDFSVYKGIIKGESGEIDLSGLRSGRYTLIIGKNTYRLVK